MQASCVQALRTATPINTKWQLRQDIPTHEERQLRQDTPTHEEQQLRQDTPTHEERQLRQDTPTREESGVFNVRVHGDRVDNLGSTCQPARNPEFF